MLVVVVLDEGLVAHAGFLLDEDRGLCYFAEAGGVGVAGFEDHGCLVAAAVPAVPGMLTVSGVILRMDKVARKIWSRTRGGSGAISFVM